MRKLSLSEFSEKIEKGYTIFGHGLGQSWDEKSLKENLHELGPANIELLTKLTVWEYSVLVITKKKDSYINRVLKFSPEQDSELVHIEELNTRKFNSMKFQEYYSISLKPLFLIEVRKNTHRYFGETYVCFSMGNGDYLLAYFDESLVNEIDYLEIII
ncbi:hypothetical protein HOD29_02725 [archaeon]|jgi:hypothetical protein|nr:hypothetical protein [archaeon]